MIPNSSREFGRNLFATVGRRRIMTARNLRSQWRLTTASNPQKHGNDELLDSCDHRVSPKMVILAHTGIAKQDGSKA